MGRIVLSIGRPISLVLRQPKTVSVEIASVNDAPDVVNETTTLSADKSVVLRVLDNDSDVEGQALSLKLKSVVFNGAAGAVTAVQNSDGTITLTPDATHAAFIDLGAGEKSDVQTITYTVQDTEGGEAQGQVDLTVLGVQGPPKAIKDEAVVLEGGSKIIDVLYNDSDKDGDPQGSSHPLQAVFGTSALLDADRVVIAGSLEKGDRYSVDVTVDGNTTSIEYVLTGAEANIAAVRNSLLTAISSNEALKEAVSASVGGADGVLLVTAKAVPAPFQLQFRSRIAWKVLHQIFLLQLNAQR